MKTFNDIVISEEDFNTIGNLLDGTDFHGVGYVKNVSLLKYGFLYNSQSGELLVTHKDYIWDIKNMSMHFGVKKFTQEDIVNVFDKDSVKILKEYDLSLSEWDALCDSYKINMTENSTGGVELTMTRMNMNIEGLIEYLKTKV
jgi:hypothetical protein